MRRSNPRIRLPQAASFISYPTQLERRRVLGAGLNAYPTNDCLFFPILVPVYPCGQTARTDGGLLATLPMFEVYLRSARRSRRAFRSVGLHTRQPSRAAQAIASGAEAETQEGFFVPQESLTKTRRSPIPELKIRTVCTIALIFDRQDTHLHFITAPWLVAIGD